MCARARWSVGHAQMSKCRSRKATQAELLRVHTQSQVQRILATAETGHAPPPSYNWRDVYCSKGTATAALYSAGTTVAITESVVPAE